MRNIICVDIGSSHISTGVLLEEGELVAAADMEIPLIRGSSGVVEYDPNQIWGLTLSCIRDSLRKLESKHKSDIAAISVSSMGEVGFPVAQDGTPLSTAISWMDRRAREQAKRLAGDIGSEELFRITGMPLDSMFSIHKILWLREHQKEIFTSMHKWVCIADYINYKLVGAFFTDYTIASRTMLFDITDYQWSAPLLSYTELRTDQLSEPCMPGTVIGNMKSEIKEALHLDGTVAVVLGGHDRSCIAAAMGIDNKNQIIDSTGIGEGLISVTDERFIPPNIKESNRFSCYPGFLDHKYITLGHFGSVGRLVNWITDQYSIKDFIAHRNLESPIYIPNTFVNNNYLEKRIWFDLTPRSTPEEITYSIYEGISFNFRQILELYCKEYSVQHYSIFMTGGMTRNDVFTQLKADTLNHAILIDVENVATLIGVGKIAFLGTGIYRDWEEIKATIQPSFVKVHPQKEYEEYYRQRYQKYYKQAEKLNKRRKDAIH
ncbi:FGGY-family carbohydrate kinase [Sediminispirochaeta smaragdinae]|uniref:Carbohydrate kinase, FGGY n=1 Tax=Sediminispirochaeta smaragdinae (strain DSM 11293 / JCM 15392 / SEBR 4228) TaxID=573413 RepID=E1RBZ1_SEDSS|nr:FGGY-family carbohydrate kinase [Sediminispirochaeta smaragdinae]ADK79871.1 Carbohydrate kinase, FGGY [Sediminispirochaeta smaragdinae DSM 11293]